jgi:hypothetical protein
MKRSAAVVLVVMVATLLVTGCGGGSGSSSSSSTTGGTTTKKATAPNAPAGSKVISCTEGAEELRATAVDCSTAQATMTEWEGDDSCALAPGASHSSCSLDGFRCQAVKVDAGASVSCERQGADVTFIKSSGG